jgi:hypothetical protein
MIACPYQCSVHWRRALRTRQVSSRSQDFMPCYGTSILADFARKNVIATRSKDTFVDALMIWQLFSESRIKHRITTAPPTTFSRHHLSNPRCATPSSAQNGRTRYPDLGQRAARPGQAFPERVSDVQGRVDRLVLTL